MQELPAPSNTSIEVEEQPREEWLVQIMDAKSKAPIAHAQLWMQAYSTWQNLLPASAEVFASDADGWVHFYAPSTTVTLWAQKDALFGFQERFYQDSRILLLYPDFSLSLQVNDESGKPLVGIPIAVFQKRGSTFFPKPFFQAKTDQDGLALLPHFQIWQHHPKVEKLWLSPKVLLPEFPGIPIRNLRSNSTSTFQLPPLGQLKVVVEDAQSRPLAKDIPVLLWHDSAQTPSISVDIFNQYGLESMCIAATTQSGTASFPQVAVNTHIVAWAPEADPMQSTFAQGMGPEHEAEIKTLVATPQRQPCFLRFQVRNEQGAVVPQGQLHIAWDNFFFLPDLIPAQSDKSGVVTISVPPSVFRQSQKNTVSIPVLELHPRDSIPRMGYLKLQHLNPQTNDLGVLTLRTDLLLLSGRVLGKSEHPLPGISLILDDKPGDEWVVKQMQQTNEKGEFFFFGDATSNLLELATNEGNIIPFRQTYPRGTADIQVRLQQGLQLEGHVLLPEELYGEDIDLGFFTDVGEQEGLLDTLRGDGSFRLAGLTSSSGKLRIFHSDQGTLLAEFADIHPTQPGQSPDPKLNNLDLRGIVHFFFLQVENESKSPVAEAQFVAPSSDLLRYRPTTNQEGKITLFAPSAHLSVWCQARGYVPKQVELWEGEQTIHLETAVNYRFRLSPYPNIDDSYHFEGTMWKKFEPTGNILSTGSFAFDSEGVAEVGIPDEGQYGFALWLMHHHEYLGQVFAWDSEHPEKTISLPPHEEGTTPNIHPIILSEEVLARIQELISTRK